MSWPQSKNPAFSRALAIGRQSLVFAGARAAPSGLAASLRDLLAQEVARGIVFLGFAVFFCCGTVAYFIAPDEPNPYAAPVLLLPLACWAWRARHRILIFSVLICLCGLLAGFSCAALRSHFQAVAVLSRPTPTLPVTGWVEALEPRNGNSRLTLRVTSTDDSGRIGERIRVTSRSALSVKTGDHVSLRVRLLPPPDKVSPDGFDFARDIVFNGFGATGFVVGDVRRVSSAADAPLSILIRREIDFMRTTISERIRRAVPGEPGALADALVTGRRYGVSEATNEVLRQAGVFHILSISGFHMALVSTLIFAMVRGILALVPAIALHYPVKSWAAGVALGISGSYLLISGADVATQRSFLMVAVVLVAIMLGREAMTLRTLAMAAIAVLVLAPEAIMGPSFQMSFAATLVLVAGVQHLRPRLEQLSIRNERLGRILLRLTTGLVGLSITSIAATIATGPFSAYHFHAVHLSGVLGNIVAAPIIELVTMPLEVLALLLWPFGYDAPVWLLVGKSIAAFLWISQQVAEKAGGAIGIKAFSGFALSLITCGLLILSIFGTRLRLAGLVPIVLGVVLAASPRQPDVLVDARGRTVAVRGDDGHLALVSRRATAFTLQQWLSADADKRKAADLATNAGRRCDEGGCAMMMPDRRVVVVLEQGAPTRDDCREAAIIVADTEPAFTGCKAIVISRDKQAVSGAIALYRGAEGGYSRVDTRQAKVRRVWMPPQQAETHSEATQASAETRPNSDE